MRRVYRTQYHIGIQRKGGDVYFEFALPDDRFEERYAELTAQLGSQHTKSHFRRAKITLQMKSRLSSRE